MTATLMTDELCARAAALLDGPADVSAHRETAARAVWSCLIEPGDGVAGRLIAAGGAARALEVVEAEDRGHALAAGIAARDWTKALERWRPRADAALIRSALATAAAADIRLLSPADPRWPAGLDDLGDHAPPCLWVRGAAGALTRSQTALAMVGARAATGYGEHIATELAAELAAQGVSIVSGGAYGIDGAAHRAALSASGTTVGVLAGGADRAYPTGNSELIGRIAASGGAIVSEAPCGAAPTRWRFLQRNRLIAALAAATVVVEAGWRSGSLNTAGHAADLGRPLGAVPGPVTSPASAGCHRIMREYGAQCITSAADALELMGAAPTAIPTGEQSRTDERTRVLDAMSFRARRSVAQIAQLSGMSAGDVQGLLGLLALEGLVADGGGGWKRIPPDGDRA
ncbi:DNA-processing protein DprA [Microbacterium sp.]|uniref:DNA-processing protein DprA n=1 Tax=Microbacterium sp. TaxID=51671 RepID=UPI0037CA4385